MKISHKDLENCRVSPKAWVALKQSQSQGGGGPRFSYNQALSYSICELHKTNSLKTAMNKLEGYLENFKNQGRMALIRHRLTAYAAWLEESGTVPADSNVTLNYPHGGDWHLGGMVSRVDVISTGYRAVLFETFNQNWKMQLRMPIIQLAIADRYGRPETEVKVGFQDLEGNNAVDYRFAKTTLEAARIEFTKLGATVLKLWLPSKN